MAKRIAVVLSQGQSQNPAKRHLEEEIVAALIMESGVEVTVVPHLYDLDANHTGMLALQGIAGDMVVLAWLYERATRWTLDRFGIRGQTGRVLLQNREDDDEEEDDDLDADESGTDESGTEAADDGKHRVVQSREIPRRKIYCLDLRASAGAANFVDEIRRIVREATTPVVSLEGWIGGAPSPEAQQRYESPTNTTALNADGTLSAPQTPSPANELGAAGGLQRIEEQTERRWYPVIDFSRCTNCMECIDFCLFGVYGVDATETILVEQPDNCRKGCPACSRVCPENAILFPQHKSPAIAGSPAAVGALKIDLSRLFGAPDAVELAAQERDEQLVLAGRDAVGMSVGIPKRQAGKPDQANDELDDLLDELDELDL